MGKEPDEGQRRPPQPPAGRASERLHQFEQERGFEQTRAAPGEPDEGPKDQTEPQTRSAGGRRVQGEPGGKALARLRLFELARGLEQTDIQNTQSGKSPVESSYLAAMEEVERSILEDPAVRAQPT